MTIIPDEFLSQISPHDWVAWLEQHDDRRRAALVETFGTADWCGHKWDGHTCVMPGQGSGPVHTCLCHATTAVDINP